MRCLINFCTFVGQFWGFLAAQLPWGSRVMWKYEICAKKKNSAQLRGRLKHDTKKPTGMKDLLKKNQQNKPKPSTEQDAINSKTQSCRKTNLMEILINLQNVFCINRETFQPQWPEKLILEWYLLECIFIRARMYPAQILLYLHPVTRDIQMLM